MADNTQLNQGFSGDTIRTISRPSSPTNPVSGVKTEVVQLDIGGDGVTGNTPESLVTPSNPMPVIDRDAKDVLLRILLTLQRISLQLSEAFNLDVIPDEIADI